MGKSAVTGTEVASVTHQTAIHTIQAAVIQAAWADHPVQVTTSGKLLKQAQVSDPCFVHYSSQYFNLCVVIVYLLSLSRCFQ